MGVDPALEASTRGRFDNVGRVDTNVKAHYKRNTDRFHLKRGERCKASAFQGQKWVG